MRLEQENDDLAHELVTSKIALRNDLDQVSTPPTRCHQTGYGGHFALARPDSSIAVTTAMCFTGGGQGRRPEQGATEHKAAPGGD